MDAVKTRLLDSASFRAKTGVIVGYVAGGQPLIQLAALADPEKTIWGRPPPQVCGICEKRVMLKHHKAHTDFKKVQVPVSFAKCTQCLAQTLKYTADKLSELPGHPDVRLWEVPIKSTWEWMKTEEMSKEALEKVILLK